MPDQPTSNPPPSSILVVGAGVFGLSTLHTLLLSPRYANTSLHLLDPYLPPLSPPSSPAHAAHDGATPDITQNPHASSIDTSRIIRADYANPAYSRLAFAAQAHWRNGFGKRRRKGVGAARRQRRSQEDSSSEGHGEREVDVYSEPGLVITATKEGSSYVDKAYANAAGLGQSVQNISGGARGVRRVVGLTPDDGCVGGGKGEDVGSEGNGGDEGDERSGVGSVGYVNHLSGVANAGAAMERVMEEVVRLCDERNEKASNGKGKVEFYRAGAASLLTSPTPASGGAGDGVQLLGVKTTSNHPIHADLTILATGAWTPSLLDLRGRAKATAQVMAYLPLNEEEAATLKDMRILLNLGTGMFAIPPIRNAQGVWELKIARHGYGYENPVEVDAALVETGEEGKRREGRVVVEQSLPTQHFTPIPLEAEEACRGFLKQLFPPSSSSALGHLANRPFASTRLCWYTDTPQADFVVDFHPRFHSCVGREGQGGGLSRNLLIATGGSGHAFKFLPVMGEKVVARLEGRLGPELAGLWEWKEKGVRGDWGEVDGSRGGVKGMRLEEEWAKGERMGKRKTGSKL